MLQNHLQNTLLEAGCDESGRGCLAGPVFAGAVILPKDFYHPLLNDSKKVTEANRYELRSYIQQHSLAWAVAKVEVDEIDHINILKASIKAMHLAVDQLQPIPELLLIDGNRFYPYKHIKHECIIKGDGLYASIAAASILAKTYRDDYMLDLHEKHPQYGWDQNKGYGTLLHRKALVTNGLTIHHRKSFQCVPLQMDLPL